MGSLKKMLKPPKPTLNPIKMAARITESTPMPGGLRQATARTNAWVQGKANHEYAGTGITRAPVAPAAPPPMFKRIGTAASYDRPDWASGAPAQPHNFAPIKGTASKFSSALPPPQTAPAPMVGPPDGYWARPPRQTHQGPKVGLAPPPAGGQFVPPPLVQGVEPVERWYGPNKNLTMEQEMNRQFVETDNANRGGGA